MFRLFLLSFYGLVATIEQTLMQRKPWRLHSSHSLCEIFYLFHYVKYSIYFFLNILFIDP